MKHILFFSGSNSSASINTEVVKYAAALSTHQKQYIDLREYDTHIYSADSEKNNGVPAHIHTLVEKFRQADGFILACPEHNGSLPAFFKNIIDWMSRIEKNICGDKPVLLLTTSPGKTGGETVNKTLQTLLPRWGAQSVIALKIPAYHSVNSAEEYFSLHSDRAEKMHKAIAEFDATV
ncbi:MAG: NADPH-dependent FMN reductase [Bacteroidales bacterium]